MPHAHARGFPRHATIGTGNGWLACVFRADRTIAGDRPPRYGLQAGFSAMRRSGSGDPELRSLGPRAIAGDRPPRYGPHAISETEQTEIKGEKR